MRGGGLAVAMFFVLGAAQSLWAGPFDEVPSGHWAYAACGRLVGLGVLSGSSDAFSGKQRLTTRFEFGIAVSTPLREIDRAVASLPGSSSAEAVLNAVAIALKFNPRLSERDMASAAADLRNLGLEFDDVLRTLRFNPARALHALRGLKLDALRTWRVEALSMPLQSLMLAPKAPADSLRFPFGRGAVALTYDRDLRLPGLLDYLASAAAERAARPDGATTVEPALRDPQVSRMRTAYEYGLRPALTLSLAYEEIARRGQGLEPLDTASLASFGIGYRLTPTTSLKVSYSLLEYSNHIFDTPPLRDRVAETAISIGF